MCRLRSERNEHATEVKNYNNTISQVHSITINLFLHDVSLSVEISRASFTQCNGFI